MKVLSLWQPWASLVVLGLKKIETRSWNTKHRGPLLIHAGLKKIRVGEFEPELLDHIPKEFMDRYQDLPYGAIVGMVNLEDTVSSAALNAWGAAFDFGKSWTLTDQEQAFGNYSPGRFGWLLSDPVMFDKPIPYKGQQGLFNYDGPIPG